MGAYVCYTIILLQTVCAMEADFFFGTKKFCRLQEALEELDNGEEADNDVDLVIVLLEPPAETGEEGGNDCIEDLGLNDVCGECYYFCNHFKSVRAVVELHLFSRFARGPPASCRFSTTCSKCS